MESVIVTTLNLLKEKFMNSFTTEQSIAKLLNDIMESAVISSDYKPGGSITLLLEHIITSMLHIDKVEDLWGPEWSVFLVMLTDRIRPAVSSEISVLGIREILCRMVGYSATTPSTALTVKTGLPDDEVDNIINLATSEVERYVEVATGICRDLDIPTPEEVSCMYDALGYMADPYEATRLYRLKPVTGKPITKYNASDMVSLMYAKDTVATASSQTKDVVKQIKHTTSCSREDATKNALAIEDAVSAAIRAERNLALAEQNMLSPEEQDVKWLIDNLPTCTCNSGGTTASAVKDTLVYVLGIVTISNLVFWTHILIERNS